MFSKLFLLFTLIPILELYTLVQVGSVIGAPSTFLIVILTGVVGAWLARMEGFNTMLKVRESLNQGKMPTDELLEGMLILVAGVLLLTPGFITDCMGLVMLLPFTRRPLARWLRLQFSRSVQMQGSGAYGKTNAAGFTYYTWHSSNMSGGAHRPGAASPLGADTRIMSGGSGENTDAPRKAMVIDCEPLDTKKDSSQ